MPETTTKPLWQRVASRTAGLFGVRFYTMLYGERSLVDPIVPIEARVDLDIRLATPADLDRLVAAMQPVDRRLAERAIENDSECLIGWHDTEIAGYSWLNRRRVLLLGEHLCDLPPEGGYTFFSYVWPAYRGKKVFQALTGAVYLYLQADGRRFCCNLVDRNNAGSIGARAKYGVAYQAAPCLKLPGTRPRVLGRRFQMGVTLRSA